MSLPNKLAEIVSSFKTVPKPVRLQLLLEYANKLAPLPEHIKEGDALEQVHECQTPFFVAAELENGKAHLYFDAPPEAPTTRGFAGILSEGLSGESAESILAAPDAFYTEMGLAEVISPLRLRGMAAIMSRLKRQIREKSNLEASSS